MRLGLAEGSGPGCQRGLGAWALVGDILQLLSAPYPFGAAFELGLRLLRKLWISSQGKAFKLVPGMLCLPRALGRFGSSLPMLHAHSGDVRHP